MKEGQERMRRQIREYVALLGSASQQMDYQRKVPHVPVLQELVCGFADDLFHPKSARFIAAFTEDELKQLAVLFGLVHRASQKLC